MTGTDDVEGLLELAVEAEDQANADVVISVHKPTMNHQSESSDDNKETLENNAISSPPSPTVLHHKLCR